MDPVSQGIVGATLSQFGAPQKFLRPATLAGIVGGMLADIDIFIKSTEEPLLNLEFHRHFTHALLFIPIGGLIATLLCWPFFKKHLAFKWLYLFCTLGYSTAGLLDACTTYGTHLFWPFSDYRSAFSIISIIDPVFTISLILICGFAFGKRSKLLTCLGVSFILVYLSFGMLQHKRAIQTLVQLSESRAHIPERFIIHPSLGNLILWRSVYEAEGNFYVDAFNIGLMKKEPVIYPGAVLPKFNLKADLPTLDPQSTTALDIKRFAHFSDRWIPRPDLSTTPIILGDLRYSKLPNGTAPLWGITIDLSQPDQHTPFPKFRDFDQADIERFKTMLKGQPINE